MSILQDRKRLIEAAMLSVAVLWQVYVVIAAYRHAPVFAELFAGLEAPLPFVTTFLFETYRFWPLLPLLSAVLSVGVLRRNSSALYFRLVLIAVILTAVLLQWWLHEAFRAPLHEILDRIE